MSNVTKSGTFSKQTAVCGFSQTVGHPTLASKVFISASHQLAIKLINTTTSYLRYLPQGALITRISFRHTTAFTSGALAAVGSDVALATPSAPTVANVGTAGSTTYSYKLVALNADGTFSAASAAGTTTTGNATLTTGNFNRLTFTPSASVYQYAVYRTAGGVAQGKIATVVTNFATVGITVNDTALVGDTTTPPSSANSGVDLLAATAINVDGDNIPLTPFPASLTQTVAGQPEGVQQIIVTLSGTLTNGAGYALIEYINTL